MQAICRPSQSELASYSNGLRCPSVCHRQIYLKLRRIRCSLYEISLFSLYIRFTQEIALLCSVWFEPTDVSHVWKLSEGDIWNCLTYTSPNFAELQHMVTCLVEKTSTSQSLLECFVSTVVFRYKVILTTAASDWCFTKTGFQRMCKCKLNSGHSWSRVCNYVKISQKTVKHNKYTHS